MVKDTYSECGSSRICLERQIRKFENVKVRLTIPFTSLPDLTRRQIPLVRSEEIKLEACSLLSLTPLPEAVETASGRSVRHKQDLILFVRSLRSRIV